MDKEQVYKLIENHYRKSYRQLVTVARGRVGTYPNAEDAVQETYTRALTYWKSYSPDKEIGDWLSGILSNCMKEVYKEETTRGMLDYSEEIATPHEPSMYIFKKLEADEIVRKMEGKGERVRNILKWYIIDGYTAKEISQLVPDNPNGIRKIVQRFKEDVRLGHA